MVKKLILILTCLTVSCASRPVSLDVAPIKQSTSLWCWAATLAMVGRYYKAFPIRQCDIVGTNNLTAIKGSLISAKCCVNDPPKGWISRHCLRAGHIWDYILALENVLMLKYDYFSRPLTRREISKYLKKGHLILARHQHIAGGHITLIVGYDKKRDLLKIVEPTPGKIVFNSYQKYKIQFIQGIWSDTFIVTDKPATHPMCTRICIDKDCVLTYIRCLPN